MRRDLTDAELRQMAQAHGASLPHLLAARAAARLAWKLVGDALGVEKARLRWNGSQWVPA